MARNQQGALPGVGSGAWYNDNDPFCGGWLRNLAAAGAIPAGTVDERSIADIEPDDLRGYAHCHFFAGIGGWAYALQLAGWPGDRPVWTGSCPCQPFSSAGRQGGALDERHLWPRWLRLIAKCRPDAILGEQVEGAVGFGWIDRVFADLEAQGYACGAAVLGAHSVGAPHIRQRLFWVADRGLAHSGSLDLAASSMERGPAVVAAEPGGAEHRGAGWLDNPAGARCASEGRGQPAEPEWRDGLFGVGREAGPLGNTARPGCGQGRADSGSGAEGDRSQGTAERTWPSGGPGFGLGDAARREMGRARQPWQDSVWLPCLDGKARRVEPTIQPLASGIPNRVGLLRGSGNAIVPQAAAEFIRAFMAAAA